MNFKNRKNEILKKREFLLPGFLPFDLFKSDYIVRKCIYDFIKENTHLIKGKFMDFGCGEKPYKSLFNVKEYIGVDVKDSGHPKESKSADIFYDGHTIPINDNYFNSALATQCFEHIFNIDEIISEINRVLKPKGILLITLPLIWEEHEIPFDFFRYTEYGIKELLIKNGFDIISIQKSESYKNALHQMNINYATYRYFLKKSKIKHIRLIISNIWNNIMFVITKRNIVLKKNTPFSTAIFIVCRKQELNKN